MIKARLTVGIAVALPILAGIFVPGILVAQQSVQAPVVTAMPDNATPDIAEPAIAPRDPNRGAVTNLPLPRFVTLKTNEGNARRGPGLTHRIDWIFSRAGMPLRVTAEYENWRRIEDAEGAGGWVHYTLLSGTRAVLVSQDMAEFRTKPDAASDVVFQAESGVIGRLLECQSNWCRVGTDAGKGWVSTSAIWGVVAGEVVN